MEKIPDKLNGWVDIPRHVIESVLLKKPYALSLFIYCVMRANTTDGIWRNIEYRRGQFIESPKVIIRETGLLPRQFKSCLKYLISEGMITCEQVGGYVRITVCGLDNYVASHDKAKQ